jgi:hypothetical protein
LQNINIRFFSFYDDLPLTFPITELTALMGTSCASAYELSRYNSFSTLKAGSRIIVLKDSFLARISTTIGSKNTPLQALSFFHSRK